ncbi:hypothetical protein ISN44_As04g038040, partial [Arabidopsis suecica]
YVYRTLFTRLETKETSRYIKKKKKKSKKDGCVEDDVHRERELILILVISFGECEEKERERMHSFEVYEPAVKREYDPCSKIHMNFDSGFFHVQKRQEPESNNARVYELEARDDISGSTVLFRISSKLLARDKEPTPPTNHFAPLSPSSILTPKNKSSFD